jgi:hypothetical protein
MFIFQFSKLSVEDSSLSTLMGLIFLSDVMKDIKGHYIPGFNPPKLGRRNYLLYSVLLKRSIGPLMRVPII